jgi:predicted ATPase
MNIKRLVIENFKSIERIELVEPNPFTVFVGPNGSGKSNIFEALEFVNLKRKIEEKFVVELFGGEDAIKPRNGKERLFDFKAYNDSIIFHDDTWFADNDEQNIERFHEIVQFNNFSRLFIRNERLLKFKLTADQKLGLAAENLEAVLKRLLSINTTREEIFEWLDLFVPSFKAVEVDDRDELHWFEKSSDRYFTTNLISDGTYNILALLTAVYQSEEPQFLCIEEPENGLHPQVIMSLVEFFRKICAEKGHYIWLNTHSEAIVRKLSTDEIVLVDKRNGATQTKQIKGRNIYDIPTDEAWLTGALGGGLPW